MGISAVPGSGKTFILSLLATRIIQRDILQDDQEILIVTLVNSAVDHFYKRISEFIKQENLLPNVGYRVRTLHGLAHDIVRERPDQVGLDNNFLIIDEREANFIIDQAVNAWLRTHSNKIFSYIKDDYTENEISKINRDYLPELVRSIAVSVIRYAKDQQASPDHLLEKLSALGYSLPLAEMGLSVYSDYQRGLAYRGGVDFDDLIRFALTILQTNELNLERLRYRWPYILEDEAQDSSRLQEHILALLSGPTGNWVRVGDPNQAIYETFTTATPEYLLRYIRDKYVVAKDLPVSGRSTESIIELANALVDWTANAHPVIEARSGLIDEPKIIPTLPGDPQPNPPSTNSSIYIASESYSPDKEIAVVSRSLQRWLVDNQNATVVVLTPRNIRAQELADALSRMQIPFNDDLLKISKTTRSSAEVIGHILDYLADPQSPAKLSTAYKDYSHQKHGDSVDVKFTNKIAELIRKCRYLESFISPVPGKNWLDEIKPIINDNIFAELEAFRRIVQLWQESILLPIDQLVLTLSQNLFSDPSELAIAHKIAVMLHNTGSMHPGWRIFEFSQELRLIVDNKRRFLGFADDGGDFDPANYPGQVVLSTIHKAKGLEWDRVYLLSVNNYDFPSGLVGDNYQPEKWFIRDNLNLEAETLEQIKILLSERDFLDYTEGPASQQARLDYIRERLRLLYVGITRAKKELIITWNTGRRGDLTPAAPLIALQDYWYHKQSREL